MKTYVTKKRCFYDQHLLLNFLGYSENLGGIYITQTNAVHHI